MAFTVYLARKARASMRVAIERSNEAMLAAQRGEALLAEAQQHLERALGVALGKAGHYTGQVAGDYQLDIVIGIGAMGEIYAAKHVETGRPAAIKLLQLRSQQRADLVERFLREGEICRSLDSPHLVQVHAVGRLDSGAPYMAMELL
jgi:serine/threonine-protein kinase